MTRILISLRNQQNVNFTHRIRQGRQGCSFCLENSEMLISSERMTAEILISYKGAKILKALVGRVISLEISPMLFSRARALVAVCLGN